MTGELCQAHCQVTLAQGDTRLADCSKSVYEMMAGCTALMQLAAVQSESLPSMTRVCIGLLKDCKAAQLGAVKAAWTELIGTGLQFRAQVRWD